LFCWVRLELLPSRLLKAPEMKIQKNARLTLLRREEVADSVIALRLTKFDAVGVFGVCTKIMAYEVGCYRRDGHRGMLDRLSRLCLL